MVALSRRRFLGAAGVALLAGCGREPLPGPPPGEQVLSGVIEAEQRAAAAVAGLAGAAAIAIAGQDREQLERLGGAPPAPSGEAGAAIERKQEAVFAYVDAVTELADPEERTLMLQLAAAEAGHIAALRLRAGQDPVPDAFGGYG